MRNRTEWQRHVGLAATWFLLLWQALAAPTVWATGKPQPLPTGSVTLIAVGAGDTVAAGSDVLLRATPTGMPNPKRARFYDGGTLVGVDRGPPWEFQVRGIAAGKHTYKVELLPPK